MSEAPYPPDEPPADGDRTSQVQPPAAPRYSASASVPVPPPSPQPGPYGGTPGASPFGQGAPYGQGGAQIGQPPPPSQQPPTGTARVAASASVPVPPAAPPPAPASPPPAPPSYGPPSQQSYLPPGGVYGQQAGPGQYGGPPMGAPPGSMGPPAGGYGPGPGERPGMTPMGQGGYQPAYGQAPQHEGVPTGGWPYVESPPTTRKSRKGLIIALIIVAVVLVVGVGGYVGWSLTSRGSDYVEGACVKQAGGDAVIVDCATAGAYRITSIEDNEGGCPDPNQPTVVLTGPVGNRRYACLAPAGG